jgi:hypothetical protein
MSATLVQAQPADRRQIAQDQLVALRGRAIQEYGIVEQSLCQLFSHLSGTGPNVAGVIFFNVRDAHSIHRILRRPLEKRYGRQYAVFWMSLAALIRQCSEVRNKIAHWGVRVDVGDGGFQRFSLIPPNFGDLDSSIAPLTTEDIDDFIDRCAFASRLCNIFITFLEGNAPEEMKATWLAVFSSEAEYPPPVGHPLRVGTERPPRA